MKRIITYISVLLVILSSAQSCLHDGPEDVSAPDGQGLRMGISTRALDPSVDVRVIVVDAFSGRITTNEHPLSPDPVSGHYIVPVPAGMCNIYVLGNEPARLTPLLDQIRVQSEIYPLTVGFSEIPAVENPTDSHTATNMPVLAATTCLTRQSASDPSKAEVNPDFGSVWSTVLNMGAERLASKVSLYLRKATPTSSDMVVLTGVEVMNIPDCGYLMPKTYMSDVTHTVTPPDFDYGMIFDHNSSDYEKVFSELIMPEYVMAAPVDVNRAVCIKIEAYYNADKVVYYIPVRGNLAIENYNLLRNRHYIIRGTITTGGEMIYMPEITYAVADWDDVDIEQDFVDESAIAFHGDWTYAATTSQQYVVVEAAGYAEYSFILSYPLSSTWTATLTNPSDFMFDETGGAVSYGRARPGEPYIIRVRPRRETSQSGIATEFYITANNGLGKNVELKITPSAVQGNRFTIIEIPN